MLKPDFDKYSLALVREDKIVFSINGQGLRPLVDCLDRYGAAQGKFVLHDKVTGLAAARLVFYAGIISAVHTLAASRPARDFLRENGIDLYAGEITANILTKDRQAVCPGEIIALNEADPAQFIQSIKDMLNKA